MINKLVLVLMAIVAFSANAEQSWLGKDLQRLNQAPKKFMLSPPTKSVLAGQQLDKSSFEEKIHLRKKLIAQKSATNAQKSAPGRGDLVERLLTGRSIMRRLQDMEQAGLMRGQVNVQPWSDDYWPIYKGVLGNRYGDPTFPRSTDWKDNFEYVSAGPVYSVLNTGELDHLSPSEKYDLLIGTTPSLTEVMWNEGQSYYDRSGQVESWMGICHGWAAASFMVERPRNKIVVPSFDGKHNITFFPADIKALISLLWAKIETPTNFVGGRCNIKDPPKDENGRVISPECGDNNPATFHMAVVSYVGKEKKSFVFDAAYDYEVWNQPIVSYEYRYFNVKTHAEANSYKDVMLDRSQFPQDRFAKYRAPNAKYLVGIGMRLTYGIENQPIQRESDSEKFDSLMSVQYVYDLELDENMNIVGGEWYQNKHPDFLWLPVKGSRALTPYDYSLLATPLWNGEKPLETTWANGAQRMARRGVPLAKIIESLIELSNKN